MNVGKVTNFRKQIITVVQRELAGGGCERWQSYKFPKANHNANDIASVKFVVVNVGKVTNFRKQIITIQGGTVVLAVL